VLSGVYDVESVAVSVVCDQECWNRPHLDPLAPPRPSWTLLPSLPLVWAAFPHLPSLACPPNTTSPFCLHSPLPDDMNRKIKDYVCLNEVSAVEVI
jgi:hypothetical protein